MARAGHLASARASGPAAAERGVLLARWRPSAWAAYSLLGLLGVCAYFLVAAQHQADLVYDLYGLGAVAAILVGVRVHRPARRAAWLTLALGVALEAAGDLTLSFLATSTGSEPFPSVADALYLAGYAALAYGLVQLARRDGRPHDQAAWVDALIVAGAATVVVWTLVFDSYVADPTLSPLGLLVSAAYPFADLVLLAVVTHLLLVSRRAQFSLTLLALGFGATLLADTWFIFLSIDGTYQVGQLVDAGWLIGYLAWGAAALHPAMARAGEHPGEAPAPGMGCLAGGSRCSRVARGSRRPRLSGPPRAAPSSTSSRYCWGPRCCIYSCSTGSCSACASSGS